MAENWEQFSERVRVFFAGILIHGYAGAAVITHGGVLDVLMTVLLRLPQHNRLTTVVNHTGVTLVRYTPPEALQLLYYNASQHLPLDLRTL